MSTTVGSFIRNGKGINNFEIADSKGNVLCDSNDYDNVISYFDRLVKTSVVEDRGNYGFVATLVVS